MNAVLLATYQVLSSRATNGSDSSDDSNWSPMQITAPIIVGVALILIFAAYIIWHKWSDHFKYHFRRVRDASVSRISQVFTPQYRRRVQHTSVPVTLDESMATPRHIRRYHSTYTRSDSTDSETPLRDSIEFSFPPHKYHFEPLRKPTHEKSQRPGRRLWRWWALFGVGPREVKPKVPSDRWVVEGPDENSTVGHGDGSVNSPSAETRPRWTSGLAPVHEQTSDDELDRGIYEGVIQIGDPDSSSTHSVTPMAPEYPQGVTAPVPSGSVPSSARTAAPEYSAAGGRYSPSNSRTMTTAPTTHIQQSSYTPGPTHSNSPAPPMYSSISHSRNASVESYVYSSNPDLTSLYPSSVRAVARALPRIYQHERQMSTESMLANSAPMVPQSMY
ncbi:uncharacterized protein F5147DRAFT_691087 [Suillus discolor]|uniref:Uncharacterized protein n=1 Tax=Suillus discolor TaxID=1912936 RepID=A0A9P7F8Q3_9AGAM|nr:uncharacterized protein F5147DRAFT_691087 [Suillus discolor]KAG2109969.1 hypothetical protein F5147DRAFT_691087 [Suillus discolor]